MTPNDIALKYLPQFFGIPTMGGVENDKDRKDAFTTVLVAAITEAYAENAKLAEAVAPLKDNGTRNEYTYVISNAIREEGGVPIKPPNAPRIANPEGPAG